MVLGLKTLFAEDGVRQVDYTFTPDEALLAGCSPIHVTGKLQGKSSIVYMTLTAAFTLSLLCDRCMTPYEEAHTVPVEHVLVTSLNREDNDELILVESQEIDLHELVMSDLLLTLPMKHLCREDCKGLCVQCGKNLNEGDCGCKKKPVDPRLEALRKLLD